MRLLAFHRGRRIDCSEFGIDIIRLVLLRAPAIKQCCGAQRILQLTREPRPLPAMSLNPAVTDIFSFRYEDFTLENYDPWPAIKAPVAV